MKYASLKGAQEAIEKPPPHSPGTKPPSQWYEHTKRCEGGLSSSSRRTSDFVKLTVEDTNKTLTLEGSAKTISEMNKDLKL